MLSFLNKKLKFLLIIILAVIGVSFIFFGQWTPSGGYARDTGAIAQIDGRNINYRDFAIAAQSSRVVYTLQTGQLAPDSAQAEQVFRLQTWNRLLVLAAADRTGVRIGDNEAYAFILRHPLFLDQNGKYSAEAYENFLQRVLQPLGVDQKRFLEIIRGQLAYDQMIQDVGSTAVVAPAEVRDAVDKLYSKVSLQYVEISEEAIRKGLQPAEEELQAFYQANQAEYATPETRSFEFVKFQLDDKQAKLPDAERAAALRELSKKAYEFTNVFFSAYDAQKPLPDFAETAKKAGLTVSEVKPLTREQLGINSALPPQTASVFTLTLDTPVSDYLTADDGFVVIHLLGVTPSQPQPFAAARAEVLKKYTDFLAASRLLEQAKAVAVNLRAALAEGKTWPQAAAAQGLKIQTLPDLVPAETQPDEKNPLLARAAFIASQLPTGELGDPVRSPAGAALFYAVKRSAPDAGKIAEVEPATRAQIEQVRRRQIIGEWINSLKMAPKTNISQDVLTGGKS
ncbi:MAG: SurA N-terminal domain-containing protein [Verrucomicrobiales bacterium]|jgi:peptidyl-prolyl cis-trans isomerase D|nr:SurA N-terminal domain-containing protein [Verrucomicrobiales bacterium]